MVIPLPNELLIVDILVKIMIRIQSASIGSSNSFRRMTFSYMDPCWAVESDEEFKSFWTGVTGAIQQLLCSISTGVLLINSSAKSMIVTGGVDSICRLWAVGFIMDKASDSKDKIWRVRL